MAHVERHRRSRAGKPDLVTWRARWRDPAGAEHAKTFGRRVDAERFLTELEASKLRGAYIDPKLGKTLFRELAERWFATTAGLKPSTRHAYRTRLDTHVLPAFGSLPIAAIDRLAVAEWLAGLLAGGMQAARARDTYRVLASALGAGVAGGLLATNPAAGVRLPKVAPVEMQFLTAAEVARLAAAIAPPYGVLVDLAAYSGLRAGELAGLRVGRLDLLGGRAEIVETITEVGGRLVTGTTKTYEWRTVRLPRALCDELGAYLAGRPHAPGDLVFTMPAGGPLRQSMLTRRYFKPALRLAGLDPAVRFHDLRHTAASLLIAQGASVKAVQAQLGHASATMTLDRYGHLFPDELEHLAERLDRAWREARADPSRTQVGPEVVTLPGRGR